MPSGIAGPLAALALLFAGARPPRPTVVDVREGEDVVVRVPFAIGGVTTDGPQVAQAIPDAPARQVIFHGVSAGRSVYAVENADRKGEKVQFDVVVMPAPTPHPAPKSR